MSTPYRVALTGGIGSGKSTIAEQFSRLGVPIIDSDLIAREIVKPGPPALDIIINVFGKEILTENGELDRLKLRETVFANEPARIKLEHILHPIIYEEIDKQSSEIDFPYCLIVVPLLIETREWKRFNRILLVDTIEENQIKRASIRDGLPIETIENILKSQASRQERLKYADDIIDNNVEIDKLGPIIQNLHQTYLDCSNNNINN